MIDRPPVWESFKVKDVPNLIGTKIGDFEITGVHKTEGEWFVTMACTTCGKLKTSGLYNVNRLVGRCKHGR